ncbi:MAG: tyrosine-protein phosphatase [Actinobacteria bacterium]|nr:tyrosine-protein phosphatase [Actinomycetota bacterium]
MRVLTIAARWVVAGFLAVVIGGNLIILLAFAVARATADDPDVGSVPGITNLRRVDERVLRGDGPAVESYIALAERGVTTVVDLRAEREILVPRDVLDRLGMRRLHIPIRDGQTPTGSEVERFLEAVEESEGDVYLHCGAGVGRTGVMAAAYSVATGEATAAQALRRNLAVGPPSLEQIAFTLKLDQGEKVEGPSRAIEAVSRFFDAPRRIWTVVRK